ncbi:MAG TPA: hypothetical protein VLH85_09030, partial [Levilinea sp.]|nr:hypothetical protein [Levilinea sp.]
MKKYMPWFVLFTLVLSSVACNFDFSLDPNQPTSLTTTATATQAVRGMIPAPTLPVVSPVVIDLYEMESLLISLYERVSPGVVAIREDGGGVGSGFVIDREGH